MSTISYNILMLVFENLHYIIDKFMINKYYSISFANNEIIIIFNSYINVQNRVDLIFEHAHANSDHLI